MSLPTEINIHVFGSLRKIVPDPDDLPIRLQLDTPISLESVLATCNIPNQSVQLIMINHKAVPKDTLIHPGDRLALFPPEYPFFVDWLDFRS
jgi:hypothetical protein